MNEVTVTLDSIPFHSFKTTLFPRSIQHFLWWTITTRRNYSMLFVPTCIQYILMTFVPEIDFSITSSIVQLVDAYIVLMGLTVSLHSWSIRLDESHYLRWWRTFLWCVCCLYLCLYLCCAAWLLLRNEHCWQSVMKVNDVTTWLTAFETFWNGFVFYPAAKKGDINNSWFDVF